MFLQFAIWGSWVPVLGNHLASLKFTGEQIGMMYLTGALAVMISPLIAGQIADRYFATQNFMGVSYLIAGALAFHCATLREYQSLWWAALGMMLFFGPTLALANAVCFHHMDDPSRDFPRVRTLGTIGWIAAGGLLSLWIREVDKPSLLASLDLSRPYPFGDGLNLAGIFSVLNGLYCFTLPNTPPKKNAAEPFPAKRILGMLADPSYAVFCVVAFGLLFFGAFYYNMTGIFLEHGLKVKKESVPLIQSIGQIMEITTLAVLPFFLKRLGTKKTMAIGIAAWSLRFAVFALGEPVGLVVASQGLHGVCFAFAIVSAMLYVERISPPDMRASSQSFLAWITYGFGMAMGSIFGGKVMQHYTIAENVHDWRGIWSISAGGCLAMLIIFLIAFRAREVKAPEPAPAEAAG
ncbi:MAG: MFS transporter [Planctomycetota bacterium]|nr:MFS transporter [Planctomycetota bacterium]